MAITKAERQELRGVVRNQFKVLRREVEQRRAELIAEADGRIRTKYHDQDSAREQLHFRLQEMVEGWNREVIELLREHKATDPEDSSTGLVARYRGLQMPDVMWAGDRRHELRRALTSEVDAQVQAALLRLDREEADLLQTLAMGAIESAEAHAFLGKIPKVAELVSDARMAELEAQFDDPPAIDPDDL